MIALLLVSCTTLPDQVTISGTLQDTRGGGHAVADATVESRDAALDLVDQVTTDADGAFSVQAGASQSFFLTFRADGFVPTSFSGLAATGDVTAEDGLLWVRSEEDAASLREEFAGCAPEDDDGGAMIEGIVRLYMNVQDDIDTLPIVTTAVVTVEASDEQTYTACYLDDDGVSDPEATQTGETGRFAVFGVPEGPVVVLADSVEAGGTTASLGWVAAGGTMPMYPAWVELY